MDANPNDDSRKKRDSTNVVEGDTAKSEEKTKKLRAAKLRSSVPCQDFECIDQPAVPAMAAFDLEDGLQLLVRMGNDSDLREYLSDTKWVNFRMGHASDASQIASFYTGTRLERKKCGTDSTSKNRSGSTNAPLAKDVTLEMTLVDGLGGGDSPPSMFAFLADIFDGNVDSTTSRVLGAAALLSCGWENSCKTMRVEYFYVTDDEDYRDIAGVLERRMWLRLSSLAIMTSNQLIMAEAFAKKLSDVA